MVDGDDDVLMHMETPYDKCDAVEAAGAYKKCHFFERYNVTRESEKNK